MWEPAWKLIDKANLRGKYSENNKIQISEKHANFLLNIGEGSLKDVQEVTEMIQKEVPEITEIEMRLFGEDGRIVQ